MTRTHSESEIREMVDKIVELTVDAVDSAVCGDYHTGARAETKRDALIERLVDECGRPDDDPGMSRDEALALCAKIAESAVVLEPFTFAMLPQGSVSETVMNVHKSVNDALKGLRYFIARAR